VYAWNLWIFQHELIEHGQLPFSTDHIFAYTGGLDFALHNYTPLAGLVAVPFMSWLGVVGTYNLILFMCLALSGLGVFVLARRLNLEAPAAWCAGALFMASPVMTARTTEHLSLVTAAPLPLFIWSLLGALDRRRVRDFLLVGTLVALATYSDAYYGIYCVLIGAFFAMWWTVRIELRHVTDRPAMLVLVELLIVLIAVFMAWRLVTGTTSIALGNTRVGLETFYTPMLALVVTLGVRAWLSWRPTFRLHDPERCLPSLVRGGCLSIAVCLVLLMPMIVGIAVRYFDGRLPETTTYWRSGPGGVDLLSYVVPNPLHPWFGDATRSWLGSKGFDGFPEFVASFSLVALAVIAVGAARRTLPRMWVMFTALAILLSLGPFVHVAGLNTYLIGPWAILRYVPIIGMVHSPSRFVIPAVMGLSLLFAFALTAAARRSTSRWRVMGTLGALLLAWELMPAPRVVYSAEVPAVYRLIAENGDDMGRVLELPTGMRDGTSSVGKFSPANQYFQTGHQRAMIGGYVSRLSNWRKRESRRSPVLDAIFELSEGRSLSSNLIERAREARTAFLRRTCVKFVVVNKSQASAALREFAVDVLNLRALHDDERFQLLTPIDHPPCEPRRRSMFRPRSDDTPRPLP
jgi:hypothetical protein